MVKKIFKYLAKFFLGILLVSVLLYGGFHLWEYATGGKYIKYLSENSETIPLDATFSYSSLGKDIDNNKLILVGEIHGFHEPNKFDVDLFKFLNKNHQVNHYIAELDFVQASLLNDFLATGEEAILQKALKKWAVFQGRNNQDYYDKYLELQKYYQELPENEKFQIIGIDRIQDRALLKEYLLQLYPSDILKGGEALAEKSTDDLVAALLGIYSESTDTLFILDHLKSNMLYLEERQGRDEVMFQNFKQQYQAYKLEEERLYGFLGLGHVFQYRVNGSHPFASKVRRSDLDFENKVLTINIMMNDSYMVMPSNQLPEFMREEGAYSRMPVSADNMLFIYIVGVKDFKRMTPEYHKSLIKMDNVDNPYGNTMRLNKTIQILPVTEILEMTDKGKPYFQYTLFVRNSDWAAPMN